MSNLRLVTVVGARPQFVKAGAVSRALSRRARDGVAPQITETLVHTGQHYDAEMSSIFFTELNLTEPAHHLDVGSGSHGYQTGEMMKRLDPVLAELRPDLVLVYGDTNSTLAAALVAAKLGMPLVHVEAGLRSFNPAMPEEINRKLTDHLSTLLFCPSGHAAGNLEAEGVAAGIHVTGDVMYDATLWAAPSADRAELILSEYGVTASGYALATVHRAENTDDEDRLEGIVAGLGLVAAEIPVILPLHPRTAKTFAGATPPQGVSFVDPVGHETMLALAAGARVGLTDSGGLQKELYWAGVPCVTLRDETEWVETVAVGWNALAGADPKTIVLETMRLTTQQLPERPPIYGTGNAAEQMVDIIASWFDNLGSSTGAAA